MAGIRVGTWNALNAFGDETFNDQRLRGGIEVVKRMDVDTLALQEMALYGMHQPNLINERLEEITALMAEQGYVGTITSYSPFEDERDPHYMSIWSRVGGVDKGSVHIYGRRHGLRATLEEPEIWIHGIHFDDRSEEARIAATKDLLSDTGIVRKRVSFAPPTHEAVLLGDFNAMHAHDPRSRLPRALGRIVGNIDVADYYNRSQKLQRFAGKVIRICRMANGSTLALLESEGFHDADPTYRPTIGSGRIAFQIDHILGSAGVTFEGFTVHSRSARPDSKPLSDHSPISVAVKR